MKVISKEDFNKAFDLVKDLDFSLAIEKLQNLEVGSWTKERALKAVDDYKKYLAITKVLNGYQLVPNGDIDEIWHYHIMDTRQYAKDCNDIFGGFLHHYPYFGMLGEENKEQWLNVQRESDEIWFQLFEENLYDNTGQR